MRFNWHLPACEKERFSVDSPGRSGGAGRLCAVMLLLIYGLAAAAATVEQSSDSKNPSTASQVRSRVEIFGPEDKPFAMPSDAAVGPEGVLYVLDGVNHRVVAYDVQGDFQFEFGRRGDADGELMFPLGIGAGTDGRVYVADSGNHRFAIFTAAGKPVKSVELPKVEGGAAPDPTDVALDPQLQRLYIADNDNHRLHIYNLATGEFEGVFGEPGLGERQFRFPFLLDVSEKGYICVVEPINTRVQVLNSRGKFVNFIGAWGVDAGQLFRPKGVAILGNNVYVTDGYLGRVQVFNLKGNFLGILADTAAKPIKLITPTGIAADAKRKRLYVVELKANRVCRIELE